MNPPLDTEGQNPPLYTRSEGSSGSRKPNNKDIICYECNEQGHYKSDCPKLQKEKPKKKFGKEKKKSLMATWMILTHLKLTQNQMMKEQT